MWLLLACADPEGNAPKDDTAGTIADDRDGDRYADAEDCDPDDPSTHPGADEVCDGKDNDCDGVADDGFPATVWHPDGDGDSYGDPAQQVVSCQELPGYVADAGDCDDTDATVFPGAEEICNDGVVQDCGSTEAEAHALCALAGDVTLGASGLSLLGESAGDRVGASLASGRFLDGGRALAIGAPGRDSAGRGSGAVWVVSGAVAGELLLAEVGTLITGLGTSDELGASLAGVGDLDGDGVDELLVGSPGDDASGNAAGAAWLLGGPVAAGPVSAAGLELVAGASGDRAGAAVAGLGDVTGDGFADWAVGAWGADVGGVESGAVYLFTRPIASGGSLTTADAVLAGGAAYQHAGAALGSAGDVDGDGLPEILVGAPTDVAGGSAAGAAYLVGAAPAGAVGLGAVGVSWQGAPGDEAGTAVAGLGDVDGDGYADVGVGAPGAAGGAGAVYVLRGPASGGGSLAGASAVLTGVTPGDAAGQSVAGVGDVDGDGRSDFLVGGPGADTSGADAGLAWLVLDPGTGATYLSRAAASLLGPTPAGFAGSAVAPTGDLDGDGFPELFVGAPGEAYGDVVGAAFVVAGAGP